MADSHGSDSAATQDAGEIRFPDVATRVTDLETCITHGVIRTAAQDLPPPLAHFSFRLVLPDGTAMALLGRVISRPADQALVQGLGWTAGHFDVVRASIAAPSVKPPRQPPGEARTATHTPPPGARRTTPTPVARMTRPPPQHTTPAPPPRATPAPAARLTPPARQVTPPLARTLTHSGTANPNVEGGGSLPSAGTVRNPLEFPSLVRAGFDQDALSRLPGLPRAR